MCDILHVEWTIISKIPPRPVLPCAGCGTAKPFRSSGRTRLNANGRRLDAWLIYKCVDCEKTWNRPIFERRNVRDIDPRTLEALQASTPEFVARLEFDMQVLRAKASRIEESAEFEVRKRTISGTACWRRIGIALVLRFPVGLRLDRLLAAELGLSRSRLERLFAAGEIAIEPARKDALKRDVRNGTLVTLDLREEVERLAIGRVVGG
ncbi:DUF1062 domain-containing protein [Rhizobium sp. LCM 4573]|uniref:DUF1062 domain-containing protein n=1 Tax=Rhizobium sp. LCM 4573 TaxID=1848291 RepID=UPI0008DACA51|nr:DUF1062 domain-containing protein [Rhizobium sp. LCM 4573]OHV76086.1 hypothetical protein LCM4573_15740 [Rhizobium sp. LCM 4573]